MATSSHLRKFNERIIIQSVIREGSASRTRLSEVAGMSPATVGRIVDNLIARSYLTEIEFIDRAPRMDARQMGRPSRLLELDRVRRRFLLIKIGPRRTRISAVPVAIAESNQWLIQFATPESKEEWGPKLTSACARLPLGEIEVIIFVCPGINEATGEVRLGYHVPSARDIDFGALLKSIAPVRVVYLQDIRVLALGQLTVEPELRDFLLFCLGDGLGAASVVGGQLRTGQLPLSGELGHTPVPRNERRCGCGSIGCVETLVNRDGLLRSFHEHGGSLSWKALVWHIETQGMPDWFKESMDCLANAIAGALNVEGISNVIMTGVLAEFPAAVTEYVSDQIRRRSLWSQLGEVKVKSAPLSWIAGMISAGIDRALFATAT